MPNKFLKTTSALAATAGFAIVSIGSVAQAGDRIAASGNDKVKLTLSAVVNRAMSVVDDGGDTQVSFVDNDAANTTIEFAGEGKISEDLTVGAVIAIQPLSNKTGDMNQTTENGGSGDTVDLDVSDLFFASEKYGTLYLGLGSTASNDSAETDLSGTINTNYSAPDLASGFYFKPTTVGSLGIDSSNAGPAIADVADNYDGLDMANRIRYDTPTFGGFQLRVGANQGGSFDGAAFYEAAIGDFEIAASAGYGNQSAVSDSNEYVISGSVSMLHSSGLSFTVAAGKTEFKSASRDAGTNYYGKIGYQANLNDYGKTFFSVDYQRAEDQGQNGDELDRFGLGIVQEIEAAATEIYIGFQHYELERSGTTKYDDINAAIAGAMVTF